MPTLVEKFHGDGDKASFFLKRFSSVQTAMSFFEKFDFGTDASTYLDKFSTIKKGVNFLERFDNNGNNAAIYLKKFNSPYEAIACMGNFPETNKFVEFAREFSNSFDSALHFSSMFNSYQEAYEHLCTMRRKCDKKTDNFCGRSCKWLFDNETKTLLIRGTGRVKNYELSDENSPMTPWFSICDKIENAILDKGITKLGKRVFDSCASLKTIALPESLKTINSWCFFGCSELGSISIPKMVKRIGERVFTACSSLATITVDEENKHFKAADNILFTKDGKTLVRYAPMSPGYLYDIPENVTAIAESAFNFCTRLTSIAIPDSISVLSDFCFYGCSGLEYIVIPRSVIKIANYTFSKCSSLLSITIPDNVETIGNEAFSNCDSLTSIDIRSISTKICGDAFVRCPITHFLIAGKDRISLFNALEKDISCVMEIINVEVPNEPVNATYDNNKKSSSADAGTDVDNNLSKSSEYPINPKNNSNSSSTKADII